MTTSEPLDPRDVVEDLPPLDPTAPILLSDAQETAIKQWAADDRLWTTPATVESNLRAFARVLLGCPCPTIPRNPRQDAPESMIAAGGRVAPLGTT